MPPCIEACFPGEKCPCSYYGRGRARRWWAPAWSHPAWLAGASTGGYAPRRRPLLCRPQRPAFRTGRSSEGDAGVFQPPCNAPCSSHQTTPLQTWRRPSRRTARASCPTEGRRVRPSTPGQAARLRGGASSISALHRAEGSGKAVGRPQRHHHAFGARRKPRRWQTAPELCVLWEAGTYFVFFGGHDERCCGMKDGVVEVSTPGPLHASLTAAAQSRLSRSANVLDI